MKKTVFMIGAGFSVKAGLPLAKHLMERICRQLSDEEKNRFNEITQTLFKFDFVQSKRELEPFLTALENVARILDNKDKLWETTATFRHDLYYYLTKCLNVEIANRSLYEEFISKYVTSDATIISLNNDMVIEDVLDIANDVDKMGFLYRIKYKGDVTFGKVVDTHTKQSHSNIFQLIKLHGSINWFRCEAETCQELLIVSNKNDAIGYCSKDDTKRKYCPDCGRILHQYYLAPRSDKEYYLPNMYDMWGRALNKLTKADEIVIVGLGFTNDDNMIRYLLIYLKYMLPQNKDIIIKIVDPFYDIQKRKILSFFTNPQNVRVQKGEEYEKYFFDPQGTTNNSYDFNNKPELIKISEDHREQNEQRTFSTSIPIKPNAQTGTEKITRF